MTFCTLFSSNRLAIGAVCKGICLAVFGLVLFDFIGQWGVSVVKLPGTKRLIEEIDDSLASGEEKKHLLVGSSHSKALVAAGMPWNVVALWSPSQSLSDSVDLVEFFDPELSKVDVVLRLISPLDLIDTVEARELSPTVPVVISQHDGFRAFQLYAPTRLNRFIEGRAAHVARHDNWVPVVKRLLVPDAEIEPTGPLIKQMEFPLDAKAARETVDRHVMLSAARELADNPEAAALPELKRLVQLAGNGQRCLVLIESPLSKIYSQELFRRLSWLANWKQDVQALVDQSSETYCVHFVHDIWRSQDALEAAYYADPDHLNVVGASVFLQRLKASLVSQNKVAVRLFE